MPLRIAAVCACALTFVARAAAIDPVCERLLPSDAVARVAGRDVRLVPQNPYKSAGGTCNYAAGEDVILMMNVGHDGAAGVARYRKLPPYRIAQRELKDLGDEAFSAGNSGDMVVARRGATFIVLVAMFDDEARFTFTGEQLRALARDALSRLGSRPL